MSHGNIMKRRTPGLLPSLSSFDVNVTSKFRKVQLCLQVILAFSVLLMNPSTANRISSNVCGTSLDDLNKAYSNIHVRFENICTVGYTGTSVNLTCQAQDFSETERPHVFWYILNSKQAGGGGGGLDCAPGADVADWDKTFLRTGAAKNCESKYRITATDNADNVYARRSTLEIKSLSEEDGKTEYACRSWGELKTGGTSTYEVAGLFVYPSPSDAGQDQSGCNQDNRIVRVILDVIFHLTLIWADRHLLRG